MARWSCCLWRVFSPGWVTGSGSAWSLSFWPLLSLWLYTWCCIFPTNPLLGKHLSVMWIQRKLMGFYPGCCLWKAGRVSGEEPGLGALMRKLVDHRLVCNSVIYISIYILLVFKIAHDFLKKKKKEIVVVFFYLLYYFGILFLLLEWDSADLWRWWCPVIRTGLGPYFKLYKNTRSKGKDNKGMLWMFIHTNLTYIVDLPTCLYLGLYVLNQNRDTSMI